MRWKVFFSYASKVQKSTFFDDEVPSQDFSYSGTFFCLEIESISSSRLKIKVREIVSAFGSVRFVWFAQPKSPGPKFSLWHQFRSKTCSQSSFHFRLEFSKLSEPQFKLSRPELLKNETMASASIALKVWVKHRQLTSWPKFRFTQSRSNAFLFKVKELNFVNRKCSLIIEERQEWCRI